MNNPVVAPKAGLEDVVIGTSGICLVDGQAGRLSYRGYSIDELVPNASFEDVAWLLWHGDLPALDERARLRAELDAARALPPETQALIRSLPAAMHPLSALRTVVSALAAWDADGESMDAAANGRKAVRLTAQIATAVAEIERHRKGLAPVPPKAGLGHAAALLYQLSGEEPGEAAARVMDVALILHADHELNASTFVARIAAGTEADMHSAITAAIATLKGPKHGGANEDVVQMLAEVGSADRAAAWVEAKFAWRDSLTPAERQSIRARFPGFGHRVYKVDDPRAAHLRRYAEELCREQGRQEDFATLEAIRDAVKSRRPLPVNVDLYSALVYRALGIPADLCLCLFAVSRIAGWTAHVMEQLADNRLIRPRSEYTGPASRTLAAR